MEHAVRHDPVRAKSKYHHGDLREALLQASYDLVTMHGAENFTLAEACRLAGVSTAAPYKHFKDRDEVLGLIVTRGFELLSDQSMQAVEDAGVGTLAGIVAMGRAYVRFAVENEKLFRLMFGQHPVLKSDEVVMGQGMGCFSKVIEQVAVYCTRNNIQGNPDEIAIRLWTFVHGAASLLIDGDYGVVAPGLDVDGLIEGATPSLLGAD
ncbi:MAG: TetR/AcrR family transcriptional regulator [Pseudomonadota bacterium]